MGTDVKFLLACTFPCHRQVRATVGEKFAPIEAGVSPLGMRDHCSQLVPRFPNRVPAGCTADDLAFLGPLCFWALRPMTAIGPRGPSLPVARAVSPRGPCREGSPFALGGSHSMWLPRPCQRLCGVDLRSCWILSLSSPPGTEGRFTSPVPPAPAWGWERRLFHVSLLSGHQDPLFFRRLLSCTLDSTGDGAASRALLAKVPVGLTSIGFPEESGCAKRHLDTS